MAVNQRLFKLCENGKKHITVTYRGLSKLQTSADYYSYTILCGHTIITKSFLQKNPLIVWTTLDFRCFFLPSFNSEVIHTEASCLSCCGRMAGGWVIQPLRVLFLNVT